MTDVAQKAPLTRDTLIIWDGKTPKPEALALLPAAGCQHINLLTRGHSTLRGVSAKNIILCGDIPTEVYVNEIAPFMQMADVEVFELRHAKSYADLSFPPDTPVVAKQE